MNDRQAIALISGERSRSYAGLTRRARQAAGALRDLGLGEGDRVALLMRNDLAYFEAMRAASRVGAISVPLNWHLTPREMAEILEHSGAKVLVGHEDLLARDLIAACGPIKIVSVPTPAEIRSAYGLRPASSTGGLHVWPRWIEKYPPIQDAGAAPGGVMFYTSGTSGSAKGVSRAAAPPKAIAQAAQRSADAWGFTSAPARAALTGPLYHSAPNAYSNLLLQNGGLLVMQPRYDPEGLLKLIREHRISHLYMTPTMFVRLLALPVLSNMK